MSDYSKLQELAEGANAVTGDVHVEMTIASDAGPNQAEIDAVTAFMEAATPAAVLELITRNKELANEVTVVEFQKKILGEGLAKKNTEIAQLKVELEALAGLYNMHRETETREMRGLRAEIKSLRKNAERYQHLRKAGLVLEGHDFISYDEIADYRVDCAMAKAEGI